MMPVPGPPQTTPPLTLGPVMGRSAPAARAAAYAAQAGAMRSGGGAGTVSVPMTPQAAEAWNRWRRRVDAARSCAGRAATVAGAAAALGVVAAPGLWWAAGAAALAVTAAGVGMLRLQMPHAGHQKATATTLYVVPGLSLAALTVAERLAASASWGGTLLQLAAVAAWTAATWLLRPARVARRMACPPPPPAPDTATELHDVDVDAPPAARWWALHVAAPRPGPGGTDKAVAPGTALEDIARTGEASMRAIIRATVPGEPVPDISVRRLSALLDVPEDAISIVPVPGRGAGVRRLTIGTADAAAAGADPTTVWAETIAPLAMPGAVLTGVRVGRPGTITPEHDTDQGPTPPPRPTIDLHKDV